MPPLQSTLYVVQGRHGYQGLCVGLLKDHTLLQGHATCPGWCGEGQSGHCRSQMWRCSPSWDLAALVVYLDAKYQAAVVKCITLTMYHKQQGCDYWEGCDYGHHLSTGVSSMYNRTLVPSYVLS